MSKADVGSPSPRANNHHTVTSSLGLILTPRPPGVFTLLADLGSFFKI